MDLTTSPPSPDPVGMELIAATAMHGFAELTAELGGDAEAVLTPLGLRVEDCGRTDVFVPLRHAIHAAERTAALTRTPDFGRRLALRQGIEVLGPLGVAARTAQTVGEALGILENFMGAYSPAIAVHLGDDGPREDVVFWQWRLGLDPPVRHHQTAELSLGIMLRLLRLFLGADYAPLSVHLAHAPLSAQSDYTRYFGASVHFNHTVNGFTLNAIDLTRPLAEESDSHQAAIDALVGVIDSCGSSAAQSVARLTGPLLPGGTVTVETVAKQFGLHPKSLQRRLAAEGTSFSAVIDGVRRDIAIRILRDTDVSLVQLSRQLGFAEPAVLTRACQRWFGSTPSAYRTRLRCAAE